MQVVGILGDEQVTFELTQLDVTIERELDREIGQGRRFLRHGGDRQSLLDADVTLVGLQLTQQRSEQRGFTGTIAPDHAHMPAPVQGETGFFEQRARSAAQCDVIERNHGPRSLQRCGRAVCLGAWHHVPMTSLFPDTHPATEVLDFWFGSGRQDAAQLAERQAELWWGGKKNDALIRERFAGLHQQAVKAELGAWESAADRRLALIIVVDQFSRAIHRDTAAAFSSDPLAQAWCKAGLDKRMDEALLPIERVFFYLPLEHSETLADQEDCVALYARLRDSVPSSERKVFESYLDFARRHHDIIERFGRFPHRNRILGRESTPAELKFLKQPGSSF